MLWHISKGRVGCQRKGRNCSITFLFLSMSLNGDEFSRIRPCGFLFFPRYLGMVIWDGTNKESKQLLASYRKKYSHLCLWQINFTYHMSQIWIMMDSIIPDCLVIICSFWKPCVYVWLKFFCGISTYFNLSLHFWTTNIFLYCIW